MDFLKDFGINPILLAAQVVNFFILLFILKKFLYGPILDVLEKRKQLVIKTLKNAEESDKKLLETNEKIDKMMAKASLDIQKMMDEAKTARVQIIDEANQKAVQNAENIVQKAVETGRTETDRMMKEAEGKILGLVLSVLKKVTGKVITKEEEKKLFEKEIRNLS